MALASPQNVPLPKDWSDDTKSAFLCAVSLAHRAVVVAYSWCLHSRIPHIRQAADVELLTARLAVLEEIVRIKDARMQQLSPESRPHFPPAERLAILAVKASQGWSNAQTARAFLVTDATVARWLKRLNDKGQDALVALPTPVNRYPDLVTLLVQQLKAVCPRMGKQRIADTLARAGLHLAPSTIGRMVKRVISQTAPDDDTPSNSVQAANSSGSDGSSMPVPASPESKKPKRVVTAKYAGHVWHVDLTAVPSLLGFWVPWFPYSWAQRWPFCYWVVAVLDHYSRKCLITQAFRSQPSTKNVTDTLDVAIAIAGKTPKYVISDQGPQFRDDYELWCQATGIKPRFGAIGQHGSIAILERFNLSLKNECTRRIVVSLLLDRFQAELVAYVVWYNEHRPHQSLNGQTPNEVYAGQFPARDKPRIETRRVPNSKANAVGNAEPIREKAPRLRLVVKHFENRRHLPIVELERAA